MPPTCADADPLAFSTKAMTRDEPMEFASVYDRHAPFVWRALRHLGVSATDIEDTVQEVFLVVHRRLADFERRSSLRTWIYGITVGIARNYRRARVRRRSWWSRELDGETQVAEPIDRGPDACLVRAEAAELVARLLGELDQDAREVFVLAELEELSAAEIAEVLSLKLNTAYSRIRLARQAFDRAVRRARARDQWRIA